MSSINKITDERKQFLEEKLFEKGATKQLLNDLSVQELIFLVYTLNKCENKKVGFNIKNSLDLIVKSIPQAILALKNIYIIIDNVISHPFIYDKCVDIFTSEEFANEAAEHYKSKNYSVTVYEINSKKTRLPRNVDLFTFFYYLGINQLNIDNGQFSILIKRSDIVSKSYIKANSPFNECEQENPKLRFAINVMKNLLELNKTTQKYNDTITDVKNTIDYYVANSKFMLPIKKDVSNQTPTLKDGVLNTAKVTLDNDREYIPLFTDLMEFEKKFNADEWGYIIVDAKTVYSIMNCTGAVINPNFEKLVIPKNAFSEILEKTKNMKLVK